ncbi:hypothetical protein [Actinoplanes missouriensis]|uniref:hypothetical protein n=1 Tax=Actinoplanes missouriensis TaxID=1866 RepID=UPI0005A189F7|nr:hypothetical protein [Actinoplanes missouriensis]
MFQSSDAEEHPMIPFTNPEIQLELVHAQAAELVREADDYRRAKALRPKEPRHWPRLRRAAKQSIA